VRNGFPAILGRFVLACAAGCAGSDPVAVPGPAPGAVAGFPSFVSDPEPFLRDIRPAGADDLPSAVPAVARAVRFSPGRDGGPPTLVIAGPAGGPDRVVIPVPGANGEPALHPDGRRIAFAADVSRGRNTEVFLVRDDGTDIERLTRYDGFDGAPRFSADGRRLCWMTSRWGGAPLLASAELVVGDGPSPGRPEICAEDARQHVEALAGGDMEGRLAGSFGGQMAASYVAGRFRRAGLVPGGDDGSFFQAIDFVGEVRPGPGNALAVRVGDESIEARLDEDYRPLRITRSGTVEADAVAVGFGIVLPGSVEDDYAGWDVAGRAAVALDGAPDGWGEKHPDHRPLASVGRKAAAAAEKKASALLVVGDLRKDPGGGGGDAALLPVVRVSRSFWDRILEKAGKRDVKIRVTLKTDMVVVRRRTSNVVGIWPGDAAGAVVVGAHYDHLGFGLPGASLAGVTDRIHPGADDNASGVAALLEIAQAVAAEGRPFRRSIVFVAFAGEEIGFLGSGRYVDRPARPMDETAAMINLDMVGRAKTGGLSVQGVGTSPLWEAFARRLQEEAPVKVSIRRSGLSASDHSLFYAKRVPVLFFFTGMHKEYHRPTDTADRVDAEGLAEVARWARAAAELAASTPERPLFVETKPPAETSGRGGKRASLGIFPDFFADADGVRVAGVIPGGPAERAGFKADDVIVRIGDVAIREPDDLLRVLGERKPDEEVEVTVMRQGRTETLRVRLGKPQTDP
jgi:hypothetical protein